MAGTEAGRVTVAMVVTPAKAVTVMVETAALAVLMEVMVAQEGAGMAPEMVEMEVMQDPAAWEARVVAVVLMVVKMVRQE
ncbi:hypothetical protein [Pantoea sp. Morm]|uniref:hypothetical protein n=1 Tax=Pantoea sp. Morm TaxID=2601250 RepID=UPI0031FD9181